MATAIDPGLNLVDNLNRRALAAAGFVEERVESVAGPQTFFAAGAGAPLLMLHGAGDHAGTWSRVAAALLASGRYRILIPDLAGHGASAPHEGPLCMEVFLAGLAAVAERAAGPAVLIGNSFGGWLAMVWAEMKPEAVERLVVVNGGPVTGVRPDLSLTPADRDQARRLWEALVDASRAAVPDPVLDELIRKGREGAIARMSIPGMRDYLMDGRLGRFSAPVDLIWGESDDVVPIEYAHRLLAELPRARLTTLPACGHVPQFECAERFASALAGVLAAPPPDGSRP